MIAVGAAGSPLNVSDLTALEPQALLATNVKVLLVDKLALLKFTTTVVVPSPTS